MARACLLVESAEALIDVAALRALEREYRLDGEVCYYDVRDNRFNPRRQAERRAGEAASSAALSVRGSPIVLTQN